jgi:hypothetical protein
MAFCGRRYGSDAVDTPNYLTLAMTKRSPRRQSMMYDNMETARALQPQTGPGHMQFPICRGHRGVYATLAFPTVNRLAMAICMGAPGA